MCKYTEGAHIICVSNGPIVASGKFLEPCCGILEVDVFPCHAGIVTTCGNVGIGIIALKVAR